MPEQSKTGGNITEGSVNITAKKPKEETLQDKLAKLMVAVPKQYLEKYIEDGIEFNGYKAQYAINLLNEVFGLGGWFAEFSLDKLENIKGSWISYGTIMIHLRNKETLATMVLADGIGGAYARRIENSLKGCKTSAFKNACRYLGIGHELYLAGHDEDIIVEKIAEEQETEIDNVPSEIKTVIDKINKATNVAELDTLLPSISKIEGKAVKDMLIRSYNNKKIVLSEK